MRLRNRFALTIFGLGLVVLGAATFSTYWAARHQSIQGQLNALEQRARDYSRHLDRLISQEVRVLRTLAASSAIRRALAASNREWRQLEASSRQARIQQLDARWRQAPGPEATVIRQRLTNPAATRLKGHLADHPKEYGELFVTNRFGVTVAATGRLTDLYQADEYHWQGAHQGGQGQVFLDDRGFDHSARAEVLGIVIPVRGEAGIQGILKANLRLAAGLGEFLRDIQGRQSSGGAQVIRANGQVVLGAEEASRPGGLAGALAADFQQGKAGARMWSDGEATHLVAFAPLGSTLAEREFGFGGRKVSEEATGGSEGEAWFLVTRRPLGQALAPLRHEVTAILAIGGLVVGALALLAAWLGGLLARPLGRLNAAFAQVGRGDLGVQVPLDRQDEVGDLDRAFNAMVRDLNQAQASRDEERELRQAYELSDAVLNAVGALVVILDPEGRIVRTNPAFEGVSGFKEAEVLGRSPWETYVPAEEAETVKAVFTDLQAGYFPNQFEHEIRASDGSRRRVAWSNTAVLGKGGEVEWVIGTGLDVTERYRREEELRLLATTFETAQAILITAPDGRIERVNRAFCEVTEYTPDQVIGRTPRILQSGQHDADFYRDMWRCLAARGYWEGEIWNRRRGGAIFPAWESISAVTDDQGQVEHYVAAFHDISERKRLEAELQRLAHYDGLTGAFNRNRFEQLLDEELDRTERYGQDLALIMFDLDHFKAINDRFGHDIGDRLLRKVAHEVAGGLRQPDRLGRWGGEEFMILLPETGLAGAGDLAERLRSRVSGTSEEAAMVTISLGVVAREPGEPRKALLKRLDDALYRAKEGGRDRVETSRGAASGGKGRIDA